MKLRSISLLIFLLAALCIIQSGVLASEYPNRTITMYVGFSPGGGSDLSARAITSVSSNYVPVPIQVISRPGAGGAIAGAEVLNNTAPDGYTLWFSASGLLVISPHIEELPYADDEWQVLAITTMAPYAITVSNDSPFETLEDLVAYAKENPNRLTFSTPGLGMGPHLFFEAFCMAAGIELRVVPYEGAAPAALAVLRGDVDVGTHSIANYFSYEDSLRILASSMTTPVVPDGVPSVQELGFDVYEAATFRGIIGHADLPQEVVDYWDEVLPKITSDPSYVSMLEQLGIETFYMNSKEGMAYVRRMSEVHGEVLEKLAIQ